MIITQYGKCDTCRKPTKRHKDFVITQNLFDANGSGITPEIKKQIVAWRDTDLFCLTHQPAALGVTS